MFCENTVEGLYNAVQYCEIFHEYLQKLRQNISQMLDPEKTPKCVSYGVSFVNMCDKIYNDTSLYVTFAMIKCI